MLDVLFFPGCSSASDLLAVSPRPLSKTVRFNVLKVIPKGASDGGTKKVFAAV